jgi:hypothetical protein
VKARDRTRFFLLGNATLSHQMGRTWTATLTAGRNVDFADGFRDPVVSDRATTSLGGNIARRVQVNAFASAIRGRETTAPIGEHFVTYRGGAGLAVMVSRYVTWTNGYVRQESDFGDADFLISPQLRSYDSVHTGVAVALGRHVSLNTNYAYTTVDRRGNDPDSPEFRRQAVTVSLSTSLPLYATVRK